MTRVWFDGFRRTSGWLAAVTLLGLAATNLLPTWRSWRGDWWLGVERLSLAHFIVAGVLGASAAYDAARPGGAADLIDALPPHPLRVRLTMLTWVVTPVAATYLLLLGVVAAVTWGAAGVVSPGPLLPAATLCAFIFTSSLGLALGMVLDGRLAVPLSATIVIALAVGPLQPGQFDLFPNPGGEGSYAGWIPHTATFLAQIAVLLSASALPLSVRRVPTRRGLPRPRTVPLALVIGMLLVSGIVGPSQRFDMADTAPERCRPGTVEVCVYPGYDRMLRSTSEVLGRLVTAAEAGGVSRTLLPTQVHQDVIGGPPPMPGIGSLYFEDRQLSAASISNQTAALALVNGQRDLPVGGQLISLWG